MRFLRPTASHPRASSLGDDDRGLRGCGCSRTPTPEIGGVAPRWAAGPRRRAVPEDDTRSLRAGRRSRHLRLLGALEHVPCLWSPASETHPEKQIDGATVLMSPERDPLWRGSRPWCITLPRSVRPSSGRQRSTGACGRVREGYPIARRGNRLHHLPRPAPVA